ncbi:LysR family transcriptional regulator [Ramlibacter tataouinensis]|uniref:Transcriptional regulator n=1 Tax=Ramlibacter tataouinensis TaxID=94132 RepID=A0A127JXR2_9BURK|nr:LysR family transcriptional regulator [Ramlibacter tataouinensis]AMO24685.1 transcriptional regulator [Ramlibacter tataouinensis]
MKPMNRIDASEIDGRLLQLLLAVLESGSVTGAAARLGVTQSAVSHGLERLRSLTGDALFVKSGRGIAATARAEALAQPARELLAAMQRFAHHDDFDPARWRGEFTIAANDFQRDLLLPLLAARLRVQAPGLALRIVPSTVPRLDMLRKDECQLVISPRPPEGADIVQKRLFEDQYRVFYDPRAREAPRTMDEYLAADHATVAYEPRRRLELDQQLEAQGLQRRFTLMVPALAALAPFLRGSRLLATVPSLLARQTLADFASCDPPMPCPTLPMYALWHVRFQQDPAHRWLLAQLFELIEPALAKAA